jgi:electron transport complex protein RnfE
MGRADAFASKNPVRASVLDGLMMGVGFTAVLVLLGGMRELLGTGALFSDMHLLFGEAARNWKWLIFEDYPGFLFAILPPGAFVGLGLLIALKNIIDARLEERRKQQTPKTLTGSKRVRVTG